MKITVYSKPNCGACDITKQWLDIPHWHLHLIGYCVFFHVDASLFIATYRNRICQNATV